MLNLVLFLWGYQHQVPLEPSFPPLPEGVPRLELTRDAKTLGAVPAIYGETIGEQDSNDAGDPGNREPPVTGESPPSMSQSGQSARNPNGTSNRRIRKSGHNGDQSSATERK